MKSPIKVDYIFSQLSSLPYGLMIVDCACTFGDNLRVVMWQLKIKFQIMQSGMTRAAHRGWLMQAARCHVPLKNELETDERIGYKWSTDQTGPIHEY
mgnify:CR=1 FL=1